MSDETAIVKFYHPLFNKALLALAPFLSRDETRPTLQAVHITPTTVSATDRYKMVCIKYAAGSPSAGDFPKTPGVVPSQPRTVMVDGQKFLGVLRSIKTGRGRYRKTLPILAHAAMVDDEEDGALVGFVTNDLDVAQVTYVRQVFGTPPPYDRQWPTAEPAAHVWLNADFLAQVADAFKKFGAVSVKLELDASPLKPMVFKAENSQGQLMKVLLMPVRNDKDL